MPDRSSYAPAREIFAGLDRIFAPDPPVVNVRGRDRDNAMLQRYVDDATALAEHLRTPHHTAGGCRWRTAGSPWWGCTQRCSALACSMPMSASVINGRTNEQVSFDYLEYVRPRAVEPSAP